MDRSHRESVFCSFKNTHSTNHIERRSIMTQMYYTIEEAAEELKRRQDDHVLVAHIDAWIHSQGITLPMQLPLSEKAAFFARQIATCRYEDVVFRNMAIAGGFTPIWIEYTADKFISGSSYKRSLVHRFYCAGKGRNGGWKLTKKNGINVGRYDGRPMSEISLSDGRSLIDYHHALQDQYFDNPLRVDLSAWLQLFGRSENYYLPFLSMFLSRGVLVDDFHAENYHNGANTATDLAFAKNVFEPAWNKIVKDVGIQPIIIRLPWFDGMQYFPTEGLESHCVIDCDEMYRRTVVRVE